MTQSLLFERQGAVARLTLNRPDVGNAIDVPMARTLLEAAIACAGDDAIRCVLLTGTGRFFCTGGDVAAFAKAGDELPALVEEITAYLHPAIVRLARLNKPVITAVNGPAAGAGIGLAVLGDIALADPTAHFTLAYTAIGMSPDAGATWLLPRLIGARRALELCLRNRRVAAREAVEIGLVTRVVEGGALAGEAEALATELARSATGALGATRRLLFESASATLETQLESETRAIVSQARSVEGREGIRAFVEKRPPNFAPGD